MPPRGRRFFRIVTTLFTLMALSALASAENNTGLPKGLLVQWDDLNQRFLFHRTIVNPTFPAIYVTAADGQPLQTIDILKDFQGAASAEVESVAGGPDGNITATCILNYGKRPLKDLILSYSKVGVLTNIIDTSPYESSVVTVDAHGNIYSFADRTDIDIDNPHEPYPTITEYDPNGSILHEFLSSANFPSDEYVAETSTKLFLPRLRLTSRGLAVFSASTGRWFLLALEDGRIVSEANLLTINERIATQYGFRRGFVLTSDLDQRGDLVLHMGLDDGPSKRTASGLVPPASPRFQQPIVKIDPPTMTITEINRDSSRGATRWIGVDNSGAYFYESYLPEGSVRITRSH